MCRKYIVVFIIFLHVFSVSAQDSETNLKEDIFTLMQDNTTAKNKRKVKKFFRVLNSNDFPSELNFQIKLILLSFQEKNISFNAYYLPFFDLIMECNKNRGNRLLLNHMLDFLISHSSSLSNLDLKHFIHNSYDFIKFYTFNKTGHFSWEYSGNYTFLVSADYVPKFYFEKANLMLLNQYDTVNIINATGYYDILRSKFQGIYAESDFISEDVLLHFTFNDFILDLNKNFFQIDNAFIQSKGVVDIEATGLYKNKLNSSENYPFFSSKSNDLTLTVFDRFNMVSSFELKGSKFFFNRRKEHVALHTRDDSLDYVFHSRSFELKDERLFSSNARFSITNNIDSLYHPFISFLYNNSEEKIYIDRVSGQRGLNPIRNTFHGLNMFTDRLEIDLVYDNCLLFNYAPGRDIEVLFESDNYFDKKKYNDLFRFDLNIFGLLFSFLDSQSEDASIDYNKEYSVKDFAIFSGLKFNDAWDVLIDFEIFGLLDCYSFGSFFKIKPWAFKFMDSVDDKHDYDSFKIESLAAIGDTVAEIDLYLNTMNIYRINKINITNRFPITLYPMSNQIQFFKNKSFLMDGNISIGDFAFSGKDIRFEHNDFAFYFGLNSVCSFLKPELQELSSSLIHFDNGMLFIDSVNNKSGLESLNDFPKFQSLEASLLSYNNKPVQFLLDPFNINYLHDISLRNLSFKGVLYLDGDSVDASGVLKFDDAHNLSTTIRRDSIRLYRGNVFLRDAELRLNNNGLFASGDFISDYLCFHTNSIELLSGKITGKVSGFNNGKLLHMTSFSGPEALLHYSLYDNSFLIKTLGNQFNLCDLYQFEGDLYFDGKDINASGDLELGRCRINSSHYYFSHNNMMSADADLTIYDSSAQKKRQFESIGVSVEYEVDAQSFFIYKSNDNFSLPLISYLLDFDMVVFEPLTDKIYFNNNDILTHGDLITSRYGKNSFLYRALSVDYDCNTHELCVSGGIKLKSKKFWIEPKNDKFCILDNGDLPVFKDASLIKKRWLLKDKIISNVDVMLKSSLKHSIIND